MSASSGVAAGTLGSAWNATPWIVSLDVMCT